ncbi:MAG TPA: nucleotide sugar dehydrogenase [Armatimonadota bacterium]|nr:nucleotide sugar dehydrogenase [Armatimonadota bacterium]
MSLLQAIRGRGARVTILGLGYVGLPLSVSMAEAGFAVTGFDINAERVRRLRTGASDVADVSRKRLRQALAHGKLQLLADAGELAADVFAICVPTPFGKARQPDLSCVTAAARTVSQHLRRGTMVVLESTTYPGTTRDIVRPLLEGSGLKAGRDFALAFAPERVDPGNPSFHIENTPRIVGGLTPRCARAAKAFYSQVTPDVRTVGSLETAEMAKLMENTFRHVNIALVNEMAVLCTDLGVDVWEMIDAAATKPFGYMPFYPGPGVGGHCIPIDPCYLSYRVRELGRQARFVELAEAVNEEMPDYVVARVADALNQRSQALRGARILVLGAAYKRDVADTRESPALKVIHKLRQKGALVRYHDPLVPEVNGTGEALHSVALTAREMESCDCAVVVTDHSSLPYRELVRRCRLILDTRNALRRYRADNIVRL